MVVPSPQESLGPGGQKSISLKNLAPWLMEMTVRGLDSMPWDESFKAIALILERETKKNFDDGDTGHSPDGEPWLPLKSPRDRPRDRKARGGSDNSQRPLRDSGLLMASLTGQGDNHVERIEDRRLVWGTNVEYAGFHQDGTKNIPARPFLGLNDDTLDLVDAVFAEFAADAITKGK